MPREVRACSRYPVITAPTGVSKQRRSPVLPMRMLQRPGNSSRKQGTQEAADTGDARIVQPPQSHPVGLVEVDGVIEVPCADDRGAELQSANTSFAN